MNSKCKNCKDKHKCAKHDAICVDKLGLWNPSKCKECLRLFELADAEDAEAKATLHLFQRHIKQKAKKFFEALPHVFETE